MSKEIGVAAMLRHMMIVVCFLGLAAGLPLGCEVTPEREVLVFKQKKPEFRKDELEKLFLEQYWNSHLSGEEIKAVYLIDGAIYVFTEDKELFAVNMTDGQVRWVYDLGEDLSYPPFVYKYTKQQKEVGKRDELLVISKDILFVFDEKIGELLWKKELPFGVAASPSASFSHIYVGSWNDRIYAISKDKQVVDWQWRTDGDVTTQAVEKDPAVFVASEDGYVYSFNAANGAINWKYRTQSRITADPLYHRRKLFVGSNDYNLYSIGTIDGILRWRYATGGPITLRPVAVGDTVYVTSEREFFALANRNMRVNGKVVREGHLKWSLPAGEMLLCKGREQAYVLTRDKELVALKDKTGKIQWKEAFTRDVDFFVTNPNSPKDRKKKELAGIIILGFRNGWMIALKEKGRF
jgi:outer membrane protein assembly factor BamB